MSSSPTDVTAETESENHNVRRDVDAMNADADSNQLHPQRIPGSICRVSIRPDVENEKADGSIADNNVAKDGHKEEGNVPEDSTDGLTSEPEKVYPSGVPFVILTLVLMATILMTALDQNILCTIVIWRMHIN